MADLEARVSTIERELLSLKEELGKLRGAAAPSDTGLRDELARLRTELDAARARASEADALRAEVEQLKAKVANTSELDKAKADAKKVLAENERLEGELNALKLHRDDVKAKTQAAMASVSALTLDDKAKEAFSAVTLERDRAREDKTKLEQEKAKVDTELARIKGEAAKRFLALKAELDKTTAEFNGLKTQKENLIKALAARDEQVEQLSSSREITLEEITNSPIFQSMLGNIRRTSRQEVTTIHEAIASLRAIDPKSYELVLDLVAKAFKKAQMENPLATLPR